MLESPTFSVLSLGAHRVLARIEIEFAHHGGTDNGSLIVTFDNFVEYGLEKKSIAPALRELEALGFIEVTERGRAGNAEWRRASRFRLTYRHSDAGGATDDWSRIKTIEDAKAIRERARATRPEVGTARAPMLRNRISSGGKSPVLVGKTH